MENILKKTENTVIFIITMVIIISQAVPGSGMAETADISDGLSGEILCMDRGDTPGMLYAGTSAGLYSLQRPGSWKKESYFGENTPVKSISRGGKGIFFITTAGLYHNVKGGWERLYTSKRLKGVYAGKKNVYVWSEKKLYMLKDKNLVSIGPHDFKGDIISTVSVQGSIFTVTGRRIYCYEASAKKWTRSLLIKTAIGGNEKEILPDMEEPNAGENTLSCGIKTLVSFGGDKLLAVTGKGIFIINRSGTVDERLLTTGLPQAGVIAAIGIKKEILTATGSKIFRYNNNSRNWDTWFENVYGAPITLLYSPASRGEDEDDGIYVASGKRLFRLRDDVRVTRSGKYAKIKKFIEKETKAPSIKEVQNMAVKYAEVSPEKIKKWRNGARWKAILPKVSLGFSESVDDNIDIYKSASTHYVINGPQERGNDWDVDVTWDLSNLVWNGLQTSIDVRSKLMVELRNEILEDVTRLYFERMKVIGDMERYAGHMRGEAAHEEELNAAEDKMLRVRELNAYIDALTGGGFTHMVDADDEEILPS